MTAIMHTKERWAAKEYTCHAATTIIAANGTPVAETTGFGRSSEDCAIDARRIVACVNACAGIQTELLEACGETSPYLQVVGHTTSYGEILKQRDDLLNILGCGTVEQARQEIAGLRAELSATKKGT